MGNEQSYNQTWDLESIFPGGSDSPAYAAYLQALERDVADLRKELEATPVPRFEAEVASFAALFDKVQKLGDRLHHASAFAGCLMAQDMKDEKAILLSGRTRTIGAEQATNMTLLDQKLLEVPEAVWSALVADPRVEPIRFGLEERRRRAAEKLPADQEALVNALSVDGYHGWGELYDVIVGRMTIPYEENGKTVNLSMGQASNKMMSGDRSVREAVFAKWNEAWSQEADLCASALNRLSGYRLALYRQRGWESVLKEPLDMNRMTAATLDAMWGAIEERKDDMVRFLHRKAELLGVPALSWHDVPAPLTATTKTVSYDEAAQFIGEQFRRFSPHLADFAEMTFRDRWIEAEDRPGKRPGGFCTSFPEKKQTRIFMTYAGNASNVATLAHELGHAYHGHVLFDQPALARRYAMNVAETASTFAEWIVADAAVRHAADPAEKLALMEDKIGNAVAYFMNIHARFLFETEFYETRKKGALAHQEISALMEAAQRKAYRNALSEYHPTFWASKLHFYITGAPFYNFPYTFGFLFSTGIYARAREEGPSFADKYVALLRDTGRMQVEDLASKHLDVDLTQPDFWRSAVAVAIEDIPEFLRLTDLRGEK